jgi:deoxyribodipyrimidine photolyase
VHDNPALKQINQDASELLCVYVLDEQQLEQQDFDPMHIGKQKGMVNLI